MEIITESFLKPSPGHRNHEIKKMSMFKKKIWMADDDEFDHIVKNSQRVLRLNDQYENHLYFEEFTKECNVMFLYRT